ncbi:hypothetical protein D3C87_2052910 [compost metagenome]
MTVAKYALGIGPRLKDTLRIRHQHLARARQRRPSGGAFQKAVSQLLFQSPQLHTHRCLGPRKFLRGSTHAAGLDNR